MRLKTWMILCLSGLVLMLVIISFANYRVESSTNCDVFSNIAQLPANKAGLLLGTSKFIHGGRSNLYFYNRIEATVQLYKSGKIEVVVISGDNGRSGYNEPQDMKAALVKAGISPEKIYLDYAGFRTYDSVYRMKAIFGQTKFTVISQEFHNRRAIFIAKALKLDVVGFNARDVDAYNGFKTRLRERFARVKVLLDVFFQFKPRFLGERILISQ